LVYNNLTLSAESLHLLVQLMEPEISGAYHGADGRELVYKKMN
jgi:hypothetical protein